MQIRRNQITVALPVLTQVGEHFKLPEAKFGKGAVGEVLEILGQFQGQTRVRMQILSPGEAQKALKPPEPEYPQPPAQVRMPVPPAQYQPRQHRRRNRRQERQDALHAQAHQQAQMQQNQMHQHAQTIQSQAAASEATSVLAQQNLQWDPMTFSTPRERFQAGVEQVIQKGGDPRNTIGLDTIPRTGGQNKPIFNSPLDLPGNQNQQQQVINQLMPNRGKKRRRGNQQGGQSNRTQRALASLDGNTILEDGGRRGGYRRSTYQGKYQWDPEAERLVSNNPLPPRPQPPAQQMALPPNAKGFDE